IAQLSQSDAVAFRVEFDDELPRRNQLYWRGPVLRHFDGRTWRQGLDLRAEGFSYRAQSPAIGHEISLAPHRYRWLFALDLPAVVPDGALMTRAFQLVNDEPIKERKLYHVTSHVDYATGPEQSPFEIRYALQLPDGGNQQARALGSELRERYEDPRDRVDAMLIRF